MTTMVLMRAVNVQAFGTRAPTITRAPKQFSHPARPAHQLRAAPGDNQPASTSSVIEEIVFYEGNGSNAELAVSLALGATLIYLPLTLASLGRRLWVSYKFTDKRVTVTTSSPVLQREVSVAYSKVKEVRSVPRSFGLWGDMVIFLNDGARLELIGLERHAEIRDYIIGQLDEA